MRRRVLLLMLVSSLFVLSGIASASLPWAEYGGDAQNTGQSSYIGPQTTEYNWKVALEGDNRDSFVPPVVDAAGTIYLLDDLGWSNGKTLKALDRTGLVKWTRPVGQECYSQDGVTSLALGTNGVLYLSCGGRSWSQNGRLYAVEAASGVSRWELPLSGYEMESIGGITLDSNNTIYLTSSYRGGYYWSWGPGYHTITAISETGNILWRTQIGQGRSYDIAGPVLSPDQKTVYAFRLRDNDGIGTLSSVSTEAGLINWETEINDEDWQWQTFTSFAVDVNGTIWVATYRKPDPALCYGTAENLFGISPDGTISRRFPLEGNLDCGSHVRIGPSGTVYVTYDDDRSNWYWDGTKWVSRSWYQDWRWDGTQWNLIWVEIHWYFDGTQWVYETFDNREPVEPVKGGIAAYDPVSGFKWRFELPDSHEANASPAIDANENIYFAASYGSILYSINKDGQVNWEFPINSDDELPYGVAPVIGLDGSVYVMGARYFYGIDRPTVTLITGTVENLVQSGTLDTNTANTLTTSLEQISAAPTTQAAENKVQSTINQINALENSGRLDAATADQLRTAVGQLK